MYDPGLALECASRSAFDAISSVIDLKCRQKKPISRKPRRLGSTGSSLQWTRRKRWCVYSGNWKESLCRQDSYDHRTHGISRDIATEDIDWKKKPA